MPPDDPPPKRPFLVTLLAVVVFLLSALSWGQAAYALARRAFLNALDLSIPLWVIAASGLVWGVIFLITAWGLWTLRAWARIAAIVSFVLYPIVTLGLQVAFAQGVYERGRLPFMAAISALIAGLVALILTRRRIRASFEGPVEERQNDT